MDTEIKMSPEMYIERCTKDYSNETTGGEYAPWIKPQDALRAIVHTREELIKKACDWLEPILKNYAGYYCGTAMVDDFRKAMGE